MEDQCSKEDLRNYYDLYARNIAGLEKVLKDHRRELSRIVSAMKTLEMDIPNEEKIEKIKDIIEPEPDDLLPNNIELCHQMIIALRKVVRSRADK